MLIRQMQSIKIREGSTMRRLFINSKFDSISHALLQPCALCNRNPDFFFSEREWRTLFNWIFLTEKMIFFLPFYQKAYVYCNPAGMHSLYLSLLFFCYQLSFFIQPSHSVFHSLCTMYSLSPIIRFSYTQGKIIFSERGHV